jgi:hypothetical protein
MTTAYDDAVIEFLISHSRSRAEGGVADESMSCADGVAIFDELDSLTVEEFVRIYTIYLLGADAACAIGVAEQLASSAGLTPLDEVARDADLHAKLARGKERCRRFEKQG